MRASTIHNNFTAGEVTPYIHGRPELTSVQKGLALCRNMKVLPYGGVTRREGSIYVGEIKDSTETAILIPFVYDQDTSYIIEAGNLYMRFFTAAGAVLDGVDLITNGLFPTDISGWTDNSGSGATTSWDAAGERAKFTCTNAGEAVLRQTVAVTSGVLYEIRHEGQWTSGEMGVHEIRMGTTLGGTEYGTSVFSPGPGIAGTGVNTTSTTLYIEVAYKSADATLRTGYLDNVSVIPVSSILEIATPFLEAELPELMYAQSNDVMYITHRNHPPQKLTRVTANSFTIAAAVLDQGPFMPLNTDTTLTMNLNGGSTWKVDDTGTMTASSAYFVADDVGDHVIVYNTADVTQFGVVEITAFTSSTLVDVEFRTFIASGVRNPSEVWAHQAIGTRNGYPSAVTFHDQRLIYSATATKKQNIFGSTVGDFEKFSAGIEDDDHFNYNFSSTRQNEVMFLASKQDLIAGAISNEFVARGGGLDDPITPSNIVVRPHRAFGSKRIMHAEVDKQIACVQRSGKKITLLDYEDQKLSASNASLLSEHLTVGKQIKQISYQQDRDKILWCVLDDGVMLGLTFDADQEVAAWHQHTTGASGVYESVATIPTSDTDQTWHIVKRNINGSDVRMIEYANEVDWRENDNPYYVDSGLSYTGAATNTLSGLDHLEGETVQVYGNGEYLGEYIVVSGVVTLANSKTVTQAHAGLGFTSTATELPEQQNSPDGTSEGRQKRKAQVRLRLYKTQAISVNGDIRNIPRDNPSTTKPELFTGIIEASQLGWDFDAANTVESVGPNPMTLLAISATTLVGSE